jgi:hypothetical protein|tara:strand:- start:221 stop:439 length:219 start_codon:yes stop_codon:yes gene_type:complete
MITIDNTEYDETTMGQNAKLALSQLQQIYSKLQKRPLPLTLENQAVNEAHHAKNAEEEEKVVVLLKEIINAG